MTYIDRDHELRESALSCIFTAVTDKNRLYLNTPFVAELQSGKLAEIIGIRKVDEETIFLISSSGEIPTMRLESDSLMDLVDSRIMVKLYSLE